MPAEIYVKELYNKLKYFATWLPATEIKPGDIGIMKGKRFEYLDNVESLGLSIEVGEGVDRRDDSFTYKTADKVSINLKLKGSAKIPGVNIGVEDVGFGIGFSAEKAILFKPKGIQIFRIENQIQLKKKIEEMYKEGKWEKDWVLITEVVKVKSASIMISGKSGINVGVQAKADIPIGNENDIANADLDLEFTNGDEDLSVKILAKDPLTPLFKIKKIRTGFLGMGGAELKEKTSDASGEEGEYLMDVELSDLD